MSAKSVFFSIILTSIFIFVTLKIKGHYWPTPDEVVHQDELYSPPPPSQQPLPQVEAEAEKPASSNERPGWKEIGIEDGYTIFQPDPPPL